jgi:hypothetical protein
VALYPPLHTVLVSLPLLVELPLGRAVVVVIVVVVGGTVLHTDDHALVLLLIRLLFVPLLRSQLLLPGVGVLIAGQKLFVDNGVHLVLVGGDRLNAEVVRTEGVVVCLRLLEGIQLRIRGGETRVMAEVGEAETFSSALACEVILWVGGVKEAVQAGVVREGAWPAYK